MKYLDEYRDRNKVLRILAEIQRITTRPWSIMEICGGQTHSMLRNGLDQIMPSQVDMIHGPGCPVCVTPVHTIDIALAIAARPDVIFCSYGDMLRVPGSKADLHAIRAAGGDVRVVYSPLDALKIARQWPNKQVVFFAIGFETTAPANAMAVKLAKQQNVTNFSMLVSHVLVPPAMEVLMQAPGTRIQAFLAAGHVCCVTGYTQYSALAAKFHVPIVVTGFEPLDLLEGIRRAISQLEVDDYRVENAYQRVVLEQGNLAARKVIDEVFAVTDRTWRGIGVIANSGWKLNAAYADFDAELRFETHEIQANESPICIAGDVLKGSIKPPECPAFGTICTPQTPLGATMVSTEGACAAYYHYRRMHGAESYT